MNGSEVARSGQNEVALSGRVITGRVADQVQAYLVVTGEYADYRVILACADEIEAGRQASTWNRENLPAIEGDAARVEPVPFIPATGSQFR